jgi:competence protein ComEA
MAFILGVATALLAVHVFNSTRSGSRPTEIVERRVVPADDVEPSRERREPGAQPAKRKPQSKKEAALKAAIDVNRASLQELQKLPGIGPKLSQRIVDERAKRPFKTPEDLRRVPGIGPKTMDRLRPLITTGEGAEVAAAKE